MVKKRSFIVLTFLILLFIRVQGSDSLKTITFNSVKWLKVENLWLNTGNASGLGFNGKNELTAFEAGAVFKQGDFHLIREAEKTNCYSFTSSSYRRVNEKFFVAGSFSYNNLDEKGARWTGTYDPYRGNPYLLADSLTGVKTHKENYRLAGQAAWKLSDRLIFGSGVDYYVAVAAKQKDPRPEITVTFLELHPSLLFIRGKSNIGFDAGYSNRKEEISYSTYKSNFNPVFFMFKGYGFHTKEIDYDFYRFQTAQSLFGGLQFDRKLSGYSSLSEVRGNYSLEKIEDGGSVIIREDGGDWKTWQIEIREHLKKNVGKITHLLNGNLSFSNGDGIEYIQDVIFTGNHEEYITISKNLKFNRMDLKGELTYNFLKKNSRGLNSWDFLTGVNIRNNREEYFYIPEIFTSTWLNLGGFAGLQKNIYAGKLHVAPSFMVVYTSNLSKSIQLPNLPEITKNQRPEIYLQEFDYYTNALLDIGGGLQIGFSPGKDKSGQISLGINAGYLKGITSDLHRVISSATLGYVF
jgi:hypothetical protein